jgi:hypothetical protein
LVVAEGLNAIKLKYIFWEKMQNVPTPINLVKGGSCPFTAAVKYASLFALGYWSVGVIQKLRKGSLFQSDDLSTRKVLASFNEFLKDGRLSLSEFYKEFSANSSENIFLKKSLRKSMEALAFFDVYTNPLFDDKLKKKENLINEDKSVAHRIAAIYRPTSKSHGHVGVAHGGFTYTIVNHLILYFALILNDFIQPVIKSLHINYKKPIKTGEDHLISVDLVRIDGPSYFFKGFIVDKQLDTLNDFEAEVSINGFSNF